MRKYDRVDQLVTKHLTIQGRPNLKGGLHFSSVKKKLEPLLLAHLTH
jgi:hypothetical protein